MKDKTGILIKRKGKFYRVGIETPLFPEDRIYVGPNSLTKLVLLNTDGTQDIIDIRPNSLFEIPGYRDENHDSRIRAVKMIGSMVATIRRRIQGKKTTFYVKTPSVIAGIRGTQFYLSYDNSTHDSSLMVKEGRVELEGETTILVEAGKQVKAANGVFSEIEDIDTSKWDEVAAQDWDEIGSEGFLSIPAVKIGIVVLILVGVFIGYRFMKPKKKKRHRK